MPGKSWLTKVLFGVKGDATLFSGGISKAKEMLKGNEAQTHKDAAWGILTVRTLRVCSGNQRAEKHTHCCVLCFREVLKSRRRPNVERGHPRPGPLKTRSHRPSRCRCATKNQNNTISSVSNKRVRVMVPRPF